MTTSRNTKQADRIMGHIVDFAKTFAAENCRFVSVHYSQGKVTFRSRLVQGWTREIGKTELNKVKKAVVGFYLANPDLFEGRKVRHCGAKGSRIWALYCDRYFDGWASGVHLDLTAEESNAILLGGWR